MCGVRPHIAKTQHKSLKRNDRPTPRLAAFYLAILRSCDPLSACFPAGARGGAIACAREGSRSRPDSVGGADDNPSGRLRRKDQDIARRGRRDSLVSGRSVVAGAAASPRRLCGRFVRRLRDKQRRSLPRRRKHNRCLDRAIAVSSRLRATMAAQARVSAGSERTFSDASYRAGPALSAAIHPGNPQRSLSSRRNAEPAMMLSWESQGSAPRRWRKRKSPQVCGTSA